MKQDFPYQLVGFIDKEPRVGEPVYHGAEGWYPQIALKRRFNVPELDEAEIIGKIKSYCASTEPLMLNIGSLTKTDEMPVKYLTVEQSDQLMSFHRMIFDIFGHELKSRYPERDGDNYMPHITAEYDGRDVVDSEKYADSRVTLSRVWLLKDSGDDSEAYVGFDLAD